MHRTGFAALVILFSAVWSSAFVAGTVALRDFDPFTLLTLRLALSGLVLLPFCLANPSAMFSASVVRRGLLLGLLNNAVYLGLSFAALQTIRPEIVIVVISCAPFVTTLLAAASGIEALRLVSVLGAVLGFAGALIVSGAIGAAPPHLPGLALAAVGMLAFATATVMFRGTAVRLPVLHLNFWQSIAGATALLPIALLFGSPFPSPSIASLAALAHLVFVVTLGGMALWMVLIRESGAATASSYHLLNPFFGALIAHLVLGAALRGSDFVGAALISAGLIISTYPRKGRRTA